MKLSDAQKEVVDRIRRVGEEFGVHTADLIQFFDEDTPTVGSCRAKIAERWPHLADRSTEMIRAFVEQGLMSTSKIQLPPKAFFMRFENVPGDDTKRALAMKASGRDDDLGVAEGMEIIQRLEDGGVIQFAEYEGETALFIATKPEFESEKDFEAADRMVAYFDREGKFDASTGRIVGDKINEPGIPVNVGGWFEKSGDELKRLQAEMRMSRTALRGLLEGMEARGLLALKEVGDGVAAHILVKDWNGLSSREREVCAAIKSLFGLTFEDGNVKLGEDGRTHDRPGEHTYMRAIEQQYSALKFLIETGQIMRAQGMKSYDGIHEDILWRADVAVLKSAETYCWFPEPLKAVDYAAGSLLSSVRMVRDLTEHISGWWYFVEPYPLATSNTSDSIVALLWSWTVMDNRSGLMLSAYTYGARGDGMHGPTPSTIAFWDEGTTLDQFMKVSREEYRKSYTPERVALMEAGSLLGEERQMEVIEKLARLFAAGALWIQQRILVYAKGHIERHERKRLEKPDAFARPLSAVQIIQLRRRESISMEPRTNGGGREYHVRWIVAGHWRNQFYPSKGIHQPKFIESYPKGPDDKPLKVPTHRVYAVNR